MAVEQLQKFTNNATTTVPATISNVATTVIVNTGTGALFPSLSGSLFFVATIVNTVVGDPGYGQLEIVKVTARSSDTMTIQRAQEGTTAKSFPAGCVFELRPTAQAFDNIYTEVLELETTKAPIASPTFTGDPKAPTPTLGDNDTSIATSAYVQTAFNTYGDRHVNMVINPNGIIRQETTSPVTTSGAYWADQWRNGSNGSGFTMQTQTLTGTVSSYDPAYMEMKTTSAKGSLAAADWAGIQQPIEGLSFRRLLYGGSLARGSWLRWRANSSQAGTASVAITSVSGTTRSFVHSFAVTTTPTDYSLFIPGDTSGVGTWPQDSNQAATLTFTMASGTTFTAGSADTWVTGNFVAAPGQSNMLDTVNRALNITDVQWNDAPILMPFQTIDWQQETARCQRYFYRFVGTASGVCATNAAEITVPLAVTMRINPAISSTAAAGTLVDGFGTIAGTALAISTAYQNTLRINVTAAGTTPGRACIDVGLDFGISARM